MLSFCVKGFCPYCFFFCMCYCLTVFSHTWILHVLDIHLFWFYSRFCQSTKTSVMNYVKFSLYVYSSYPVPELYLQIEYKLVCCCHFKFFQLEVRRKKCFSSYNFVPPLLACCHVHMLCLVEWSSCASDNDLFLPLGEEAQANIGGSTARLQHCTECVMWRDVH
jgi:hypothetical protein